jgi:hypothetical protein
VADLKAAAEARVAHLRESIRKEHLELEVVTQRIRDHCWEAMDDHQGQFVTGMKCGAQVRVFRPLHGRRLLNLVEFSFLFS